MINRIIGSRVIACVLIVLLISTIGLFDSAYADDRQENDNEIMFEINKDSDNIIYYFTEDENGNIKIIDEGKAVLIDSAFGFLTVNSWVGNNVNMTIKVTSESALLSHSGTISFLKVTSLGLPGSVFNSATFSTSSPIGLHTLYKQVTMNACGKSQIYIKLSNLKVYDTYGDVLSMNPIGPKKFKKSNFS